MKTIKTLLLVAFAGILVSSCGENKTATTPAVHAQINTPNDALAELKDGNKRFLDGKMANTDYIKQVADTKGDQHPHTMILSCMDSRIPPEIIFDQGIGNLFVARVAGNVEDSNILGSIEYATKVKGTKLIVVMGHQRCGAVKGCIDNVKMGNLTHLLDEIKPAITGDTTNKDAMLEATVRNNVKLTISEILAKSEIVSDLVKQNKVKIIGAYYNLDTGAVSFMD
jgi:carbonic anhydrase